MNEPKFEFKDRLKQAINARNMKPVELSEKTGISKSTISQYMSGYSKPKDDKLYLISKALNVKEAWLLGFETTMDRVDLSSPTLDAQMSNDKRIKELYSICKDFSDEQFRSLVRYAKFIKEE